MRAPVLRMCERIDATSTRNSFARLFIFLFVAFLTYTLASSSHLNHSHLNQIRAHAHRINAPVAHHVPFRYTFSVAFFLFLYMYNIYRYTHVCVSVCVLGVCIYLYIAGIFRVSYIEIGAETSCSSWITH